MTAEVALSPRTGLGATLLDFLRAKPLGALGGIILLLMILVAILAPVLAQASPTETNMTERLAPPSISHLLGTDELGRDVLSRIVYGSRVSLYVGLLGTLLGTVAGAVIGAGSAFFGGKVDLLVQRSMDVLMSFPTLILALAIMAVLGSSSTNVIIAIAIAFVPRTNRLMRSPVLAIKELPYIEAATAVGCSPVRIILRHILPNTFAPYIIMATGLLGTAVLIEASLSFLGLGIPPPIPSWGRSLSDAMSYIDAAPWLCIFPGVALAMAVFGFNLLGDALRDSLDPRLRQR